MSKDAVRAAAEEAFRKVRIDEIESIIRTVVEQEAKECAYVCRTNVRVPFGKNKIYNDGCSDCALLIEDRIRQGGE